MADANTQAAGAPAAIDVAKVIEDAMGKAVASLESRLSGLVSEATKPLADRLEKIASMPTATAEDGKSSADGKAKPLTLEDVAKLLDSRDKQQQTASQQADAKRGFVADKLKDLPAAYQAQLGNDPAKWAAEEQSIRGQYKADIEKAGVKIPPVGGDNPGGSSPAAAIDTSKLKGRAALEAGIIAESKTTK